MRKNVISPSVPDSLPDLYIVFKTTRIPGLMVYSKQKTITGGIK